MRRPGSGGERHATSVSKRSSFRTSASFSGEVVGLTGNPHDAEDLVQETLLRAHRGFDGLAAGSNARAWLHTILVRVRTDLDRRSRRRPETVELKGDGPAAASAPQDSSASLKDLEAALLALPETFRDAVVLRDIQDMSYTEIASALGVPIGTVMSRIHPRTGAPAADARREPAMSCEPEQVTALVDGELAPAAAAAVAALTLKGCPFGPRAGRGGARAGARGPRALPAPDLPLGLQARLHSRLRRRRQAVLAVRLLPLAAALVAGMWLRGSVPFVAWYLARDHDKCFSRHPVPAKGLE